MGGGKRKPCVVDGCRNLSSPGHRWCATHQWRWRHYRDLDHVRTYRPAEERFWSRVDSSGACWLWTGGHSGDGYGAITVDGRTTGAHRYSYGLNVGPIPTGMYVMHTCDVPLCVNPAHLRLGTPSDNGADSARKARRPRGSKQHASKLTEGQVLDMRARYAAGGITQKQLAVDYGISHALVSFIVTRRIWKHI
jgi:hypothetical protein